MRARAGYGLVPELHIRRVTPHAGGWTLIELMVVLGIIAVLLAILIPVLRRVREAGREVQCTNNLHQLSAAFLNFAVDHERRLPGGISDGDDPDPDHHDWLMGNLQYYTTAPEGGTVYKYVQNTAIYRCPSLEVNAPRPGMFGPLSGSNGRFDYAAIQMFTGARLDTLSSNCRVQHTDGSDPQYVVTPLLVEKDATLINGLAINGAQTSNYTMSHHHHQGSLYASVNGSVTWINEAQSNATNRGCKLWESYSPSGKWVSLGLHDPLWGVWNNQ